MNFSIIIDVVNLINCFMTTITFTSTLMQVTKRLPTPITDLFVEVEVPTGYKSEFNEVNVIDNIQVTDHIFLADVILNIFFARLSSPLRAQSIRCAG